MRLVERPVLGVHRVLALVVRLDAAPRAVAVAAARRAGRLRGLVLRPRQVVGHQVRVGPRSVRRVRQVRPDAAVAAAAVAAAAVAAAARAVDAAARAVDAAAAPRAVAVAASSTVGSTALVATVLRTTRVDDRLERGGLRSQWLHHAELTGGVRGRDARLDKQVDVVRHRQLQLPALLHLSRQQHPCQQ